MHYLTYGSSTADLEEVREAIEKALNITMVTHDSSYWGEYYLWKSLQSNDIRLVYNKDPLDNEPFEGNHAHLSTIIYTSFDAETYEIFHPVISSLRTVECIRHK